MIETETATEVQADSLADALLDVLNARVTDYFAARAAEQASA